MNFQYQMHFIFLVLDMWLWWRKGICRGAVEGYKGVCLYLKHQLSWWEARAPSKPEVPTAHFYPSTSFTWTLSGFKAALPLQPFTASTQEGFISLPLCLTTKNISFFKRCLMEGVAFYFWGFLKITIVSAETEKSVIHRQALWLCRKAWNVFSLPCVRASLAKKKTLTR